MSPNRHQRQWDPEVTMNLIHCLTGGVSCVGEARTYGRRCKRRIGRPRILAAYEILYALAKLDPLAAAASPDLLKAIDLLLCYQHGGQRSEVAEQWRDGLNEELRGMQKEGREFDDEKGWQREERRRPGHEAKQKREREDKRKQEKERQQQEQEERQRREREERERQKQEEKRRQQDEKEQREEKEKKRREKEGQRRKQEQARREEEARQRSQREKEDAARQSRTWDWEGYLSQWKIIESQEGKEKKLSYKQLPCPTKSGMWEDVNEAKIRSFFEDAAKIYSPKQPNESLYQLLCRETKRWHPDKLIFRFGREVFASPYQSALDLITKEVVAMWKKAKLRRSQ